MLQIGDYDDLNTEAEKKLGALIKKEYGTDFFIMYKFPLEVFSQVKSTISHFQFLMKQPWQVYHIRTPHFL